MCVCATGWQAEQWGSKEGQRWGRSRVAQGCMVLEGHRQVCCSAQQMSASIMSCLLIDKVRLLFPDGLAWLCLLHLKTSLCGPAVVTIQRCRDRVRSPTHGCHSQPASPHEIALLGKLICPTTVGCLDCGHMGYVVVIWGVRLQLPTRLNACWATEAHQYACQFIPFCDASYVSRVCLSLQESILWSGSTACTACQPPVPPASALHASSPLPSP